ncbi:hypothetical protein COLO4_35908 [Corchorus olitorius]|uniref:Uncharacterized protein n=1 Tax=Corchorus olitorius TaxID=93759 RepID=A0A1R3GC04_9ROSI|nr:hypothetical protein COLO4_35908 [Corchorus olitorius]
MQWKMSWLLELKAEEDDDLARCGTLPLTFCNVVCS